MMKPFNRIRLVILPENAASRRLAEKCGFRHEGTARQAYARAMQELKKKVAAQQA